MVHGAEADRVALPRDVADAAVKILAKQRAKPNFGNAGAATALLSRAKEVPDDVSSFFLLLHSLLIYLYYNYYYYYDYYYFFLFLKCKLKSVLIFFLKRLN